MDLSILNDVLDFILSVLGLVLLPYMTFLCVKYFKTESNKKDEGDK